MPRKVYRKEVDESGEEFIPIGEIDPGAEPAVVEEVPVPEEVKEEPVAEENKLTEWLGFEDGEFLMSDEVTKSWLSKAYLRKTNRYKSLTFFAPDCPEKQLGFACELAVRALKEDGLLIVSKDLHVSFLATLVKVQDASPAGWKVYRKANK